MELDFDKISLSKKELKALLLLEKHNLIPEDYEANVEIQRLNRLELSEYYRTSVDNTPRIGVHITDTGN